MRSPRQERSSGPARNRHFQSGPDQYTRRRYRSHFREATSFAVLLPNAGAERGAIIAADLRGLISKCSVEAEDSEIRLSISVGVVQIDSDTKDEESVFIEADRLMYEDKRQAEAHN